MDTDDSIKFTILTGDFSSGSSNSGSNGYNNVNTPLRNLGDKLLMINGNHDVWDAFLQSQQNATAYIKEKVTNKDVIWGDSNNIASYWYRDFIISNNSKLRIIGIDQYEYGSLQGSKYDTLYTQTQVDWIVLRLLELSSTDYLIIAMHEPPVNASTTNYQYNQEGMMDNNIVEKRRANKFCSSRLWVWDTSLSNGILLPTIIKAYENKESLSTTIQQLNSNTQTNVSSLSLTYDFSVITQPAKFLCYIGGHLHGEYAEYHPIQEFSDQLLLFVDNSNPSTLGNSSDIGQRSSNTANGSRQTGKLINKIELNFENQTINITRIGEQQALSYNGIESIIRNTIQFPFTKQTH